MRIRTMPIALVTLPLVLGGAAAPASDLTHVPSANPKVLNVTLPSVLSPELAQVAAAQGSTPACSACSGVAALHTYGIVFNTGWVTVHDTDVDGFAVFNANALAKARGATPFKRPENGQFRPGSHFREFFFDERVRLEQPAIVRETTPRNASGEGPVEAGPSPPPVRVRVPVGS